MTDDMLVALIMSIVLVVFMAAFVTFEIVYIKRIRKKYIYRWQAHEIVFEIASRSVRLYVDGVIEDELGAQNIRICTLRAFAEGTEIKAHLVMRGLRVQLDVTAGNMPLQLISVTK